MLLLCCYYCSKREELLTVKKCFNLKNIKSNSNCFNSSYMNRAQPFSYFLKFEMKGVRTNDRLRYPTNSLFGPVYFVRRKQLNLGRVAGSDEDVAFVNTAVGTVGRRRESMLDNRLLHRVRTGHLSVTRNIITGYHFTNHL